MYDFTVRLAKFAPRRVDRLLLAAIADRPEEVTRFLGVFSGSVPMNELRPLRLLLRRR